MMAFSYTIDNATITSSLADDDFVHLLDNENIQFKVHSEWARTIISASYDKSEQYVTIQTQKPVDFVQVFDEDHVLQYQLPVESELMSLSLEDFEKGVHELGLFFNNRTEISMAYLTILNK